jgi:hypothetical protein
LIGCKRRLAPTPRPCSTNPASLFRPVPVRREHGRHQLPLQLRRQRRCRPRPGCDCPLDGRSIITPRRPSVLHRQQLQQHRHPSSVLRTIQRPSGTGKQIVGTRPLGPSPTQAPRPLSCQCPRMVQRKAIWQVPAVIVMPLPLPCSSRQNDVSAVLKYYPFAVLKEYPCSSHRLHV